MSSYYSLLMLIFHVSMISLVVGYHEPPSKFSSFRTIFLFRSNVGISLFSCLRTPVTIRHSYTPLLFGTAPILRLVCILRTRVFDRYFVTKSSSLVMYFVT